MVLFAGFAKKIAQVLADVNQCAVGVATGAKSSTFSIDATASITGAVTSSAKPASGKSKLVDVTRHAPLFAYLPTGSIFGLRLKKHIEAFCPFAVHGWHNTLFAVRQSFKLNGMSCLNKMP